MTSEQRNLLNTIKEAILNGAGMPLLLLAMLAMVVVPLPAILLDGLFTFNICLSLIVILAVIYALRPLDLAAFPTVLLLATLLRLALNVASTRIVLLEGHTGTDAAGKVIEAFGDFVVGGNYTVGIVVFAILVIINFVVVTKGAGRVSEVSARFTLDALPGKQMAIDADLNAGIINQEEAAARRVEIRTEADFYGSMDGASKFVRGDAVAGLLILFINLIGGIMIGAIQHDMSMADAAQTYALLTIGDGLVAQIPSLLLATAVAIIVTRMSRSEDMGSQLTKQLFSDRRVLWVATGLLTLLGLIPGMPHLAFLLMAAACGGFAWFQDKRKQDALEQANDEVETVDQGVDPLDAEISRELSWDDVGQADPVALDVGYRLIPLVDKNQGGELMRRIKGVRRRLSEELGFLVAPVRIRDDLDLGASSYRISLLGSPVTQGEVYVDKELAINPGHIEQAMRGITTTDPAFGLEAVWIDPAQREEAQGRGYTVVDVPTVIATHLSKVLQDNAHELLGHQETQELLDRLARSAPKLVEELVPKTVPLSTVVRVLQELLRDQIPVTNMRTICQVLAEHGRSITEPAALVSQVRIALGRTIVQRIGGDSDELPVITLDPDLEQMLQKAVDGNGGIEPTLAEKVQNELSGTTSRQEAAGEPAVLLVSPGLRPWLSRFLRFAVPSLKVLAYNEVPDSKRIRLVAAVGA